jgi:hypothetical protein
MRIVEICQNGRPPWNLPRLKTWCESLVLVLLSSNLNRSTNYPGTFRSQPDAHEVRVLGMHSNIKTAGSALAIRMLITFGLVFTKPAGGPWLATFLCI